MYWSPNFLAVVFKKHVLWSLLMSTEATRMQDLASEFASEFSPNFPGVQLIVLDPHSGRGDPLGRQSVTPHPQPGLWPGAPRCWDPIKPWPPSTFQPWLRPCIQLSTCKPCIKGLPQNEDIWRVLACLE